MTVADQPRGTLIGDLLHEEQLRALYRRVFGAPAERPGPSDPTTGDRQGSIGKHLNGAPFVPRVIRQARVVGCAVAERSRLAEHPATALSERLLSGGRVGSGPTRALESRGRHAGRRSRRRGRIAAPRGLSRSFRADHSAVRPTAPSDRISRRGMEDLRPKRDRPRRTRAHAVRVERAPAGNRGNAFQHPCPQHHTTKHLLSSLARQGMWRG
jgi:hypothetical protein